ncbi:MAG: hypothetical protein HON55_00525, partial [Legionellales bacterium]|nr:hypothetical protein [Legionellales bacterium]
MADYFLKIGVKTSIKDISEAPTANNDANDEGILINEAMQPYLKQLGDDTTEITASKDAKGNKTLTTADLDLSPLLNITADGSANAAVLKDMMQQDNVPPELLTKIASNITKDDTSIILNAVEIGNPDYLDAIQKGLKGDKGGLNTLYTIKVLNQDINRAPLHRAIEKAAKAAENDPASGETKNALAIVKYLANDPNIDFTMKKSDKRLTNNHYNIIHAAVETGNPKILEIILDPDNQNLTKVSNLYIKIPYASLPINQQDTGSNTPLHRAIKKAEAAADAKPVDEGKVTAALTIVTDLAGDPNIDF